MWHKPCRTFHPWCPCIKTRCLLALSSKLIFSKISVIGIYCRVSTKTVLGLVFHTHSHKMTERCDSVCGILSFDILSKICFLCINHVYWNYDKPCPKNQVNMLYTKEAHLHRGTKSKDTAPWVTDLCHFNCFNVRIVIRCQAENFFWCQ